jgi:hypothetical protein
MSAPLEGASPSYRRLRAECARYRLMRQRLFWGMLDGCMLTERSLAVAVGL